MIRTILFLSLITQISSLRASHIVGGVIYYEYLGGSKYKLIFEIYRDCGPESKVDFDGTKSNNPTVQLPPFYFSIFKGNVDLNIAYNYNELTLKPEYRSNIKPKIVNPCLKVDKSTCVEKGIYEIEVTLPNNTEGYTIQHMRCCRNDGILNIKNQVGEPDKPGITLRTYIPPANSIPNNSARFKELPPIFICLNQAFYFDHSATDIDGDELRYFLSTPLAGLNSNKPVDKDQTLNVSPVEWSNGYGVNNIIGGTPAMSIDSITGLLVCKPNRVGRFVASVMVKEIRNGVIIDSFARDFQYNVVDCDLPNPDLPFLPGTYDPNKKIGIYELCGDYKINFTNTSTNADRYEWNFGDPNSGANNTSTAISPTHIFSDTGTFIVTLRAFKKRLDGQLCFDTTRRICRIYPKPTIKIDFKNEVCEGSQVQFTDLSTTKGGVINQWEWTFGNGAKSNLKNPATTYLSAGNFNVKLKVTTSNTCVADTQMPILIHSTPKIAATVPNGCIGQPADFKCNVSISSPSVIDAYRWTFPDGSIFNSCNIQFTPTSISSGNINLWARSNKGCSDSANFPYQVYPLPSIRASNDTILCYDQTTTISATGGKDYSWTPTDYLSNPNTASALASPPYPDSIIYLVKGVDANGCFNYDSVKIRFFTKSFIDAGRDTSICLPPSLVAKDNVRLNGLGTFQSLYWTPASSLSNPNIASPIARPTETTDYIFHGIDVNQCLIRDTVRVVVLDPNIDLIKLKTQTICFGDSFQVFPEDQGMVSNYNWSPTGSNIISNPFIRTPILKPIDTTPFILRLSNYCYTKIDTLIVNVKPLPDVGLLEKDSICLGSTYQFVSNPNHTSYTWQTDESTFSNKSISNPTAKPLQTKKYILTVIDTNSCTNTDTIELLVHNPPLLNVINVPRFICEGDTISLTAITNEACRYFWWNASVLSSDTAKSVRAFPMKTTKLNVRATNIHQCSSVDSFQLIVQNKIFPYVKRPVRICKGKHIHLYAEGGLYYLWKPPYNINDTLTTTPQVYPDSFFTYTVNISNDCFMDSISVDVYVDSLPTVDLGKDTSIYRGQEIVLEAKTQASKIEWYPKSELLSNPFIDKIQVHPKDSTLYWVEVTDGMGCVGTDSVNVMVYGRNVLLIPTAFSPNLDGKNDVFKIMKHLNIRKLRHLKVYNRWGSEVFSTDNINEGWNGFYKDQPSPSGVYVWYVEAETYDNEVISKTGNVTLIY